MSRIFSTPKMPSAPAMTFTPISPSFTPQPVPKEPDGPTPEQTADEERLKNILNRRRGRLGTIETSFTGALSNAPAIPVRKTLLGE